jgi:uncharacterized protein (DUF1697 family)
MERSPLRFISRRPTLRREGTLNRVPSPQPRLERPGSKSMKTYVALFRGVNVGGSHVLPMRALTSLLEKHGCADVRTYIQSGNVVFRSAVSDADRLAAALMTAVSRGHGFRPRVLVLTRSELERAAASNPFPEADEAPKTVHVFFLAERPKKPDLEALESVRVQSERFALEGKVFYLHTPDGFGTSKLAGRVERFLGVEATARNWRTVKALLEMATASR